MLRRAGLWQALPSTHCQLRWAHRADTAVLVMGSAPTLAGDLSRGPLAKPTCSPFAPNSQLQRSAWLPDLRRSRHLLLAPPLQMGRRSAKIAGRKGAQDARKAKLYSRICKLIIREARAGGTDPISNVRLAAALQQAKNAGVPKDAVARNIAKATDKSQADFTEVIYEAIGAGGSGFIIDCLTDNSNRSAMEVRTAVTRSGAKMADPGSVAFSFRRAGVVAIAAGADEEQVFDAAMEAGADDIESVDDEHEDSEISFKVVTKSAKEFAAVRSALAEAGLPIDDSHSGLVYLPLGANALNEDDYAKNQALTERLLALDDVDNVFSSCSMH